MVELWGERAAGARIRALVLFPYLRADIAS